MTNANNNRRLIVLSGLSGSGKTVALHSLEDLNYYCIDNLPAGLLDELARQVHDPQRYAGIAAGIDIRNPKVDLERLPQLLAGLREDGWDCLVLFLTSNETALIRRYSETRRRHPLSQDAGVGLAEAIESERLQLSPIGDIADLTIDTSELNVHQLRRRIWEQCATGSEQVALLVKSFAYKRGLPRDLDYCFDTRCLPNPHWVEPLRAYSGLQAPVRDWLNEQPTALQLVNDIHQFLAKWLVQFEPDQRSYVTIGVGCTGGKHRSVFVAERLAELLRTAGQSVHTYHRELT